jgi:hypothetical protein
MKKTSKKIILLLALLLQILSASATRKSIAILNLNPSWATDLARIELNKLDTFLVLDKYDMFASLLQKSKVDSCFDFNCLLNAGKLLKVDFILTGTVQDFDTKRIISFKLIDIQNSTVLRTNTIEYILEPKQLQLMFMMSLKQLFNMEYETAIFRKITVQNDFENEINNPEYPTIHNSGIRMGAVYISGKNGQRLQDPVSQGGYNALPLMSLIAYQYEVKYLTKGRIQGICEFILGFSGLDQGRVSPSFTFLNGFRDNKHGWEFAIGPSIGIIRKAEFYYLNNNWNMVNGSTNQELINNLRQSNQTISRLDRRGNVSLNAGFVFGIGKTFRSGKVNMPVNLHIIPTKEGTSIGLSFGFNSKK